MKEPAVKKQPAAKKLPVVPVKKGTAQASCCHTPPVAAAACLTHTGKSVLFIIRPLTSLPNTPGARLQTRAGEEGGAQKHGAGAPSLFPSLLPPNPVTTQPVPPRAPAHIWNISSFRLYISAFPKHLTDTQHDRPRTYRLVSLECTRTIKYLLITISGARSKSPRPSSTRTAMLRRQ